MSDLSAHWHLDAAHRAALEGAIARGLAPLRFDPPMRGSEWAAAHFYLSTESSYVEQRWTAYPFQVAILDAMCDDRIEVLDFMKSARVGYTKMLLAAVGYFAHHKRRNQVVYQPTDDDSDDFCKTELEPMLRDVPVMASVFPTHLQRHKDNTLKQKKFIGSILHLRGGKAAKNYRRLTVDVVVLDEIDGFDQDIEGEGDPNRLSGKRLEGATFPKHIRGSTPKIKGASHIERGHDAADLRLRFHVPCPECGHEHPLAWGDRRAQHGMKWTEGQPDTIRQLCPECGALYDQAAYLRVWQRGRWKAADGTWIDDRTGTWRDARDAEIQPPRHVAFHVWTAYSPQATWPAIAREYLQAVAAKRSGDPSPLKTFKNTTFGETYEEVFEQADGNALKERAEDYPLRTCPLGCLVLGAGVDVQDNRFEVTTWGFGVGEEMWAIDYIVIHANPAEQSEWDKLDAYLDTRFPHASGQTLGIEAYGVDTGGHFTHQAYAFCRARNRKRAFAIKGDTQLGKPIKGRASLVDVNINGRIIKNGVKLWFVGTDTAKDLLYGRLGVKTPGPGYVHFSKALPDTFYTQLTAEARVPQQAAGGIVYRWVLPPGRRNEVLDCTVYALFIAQALDLHRYTASMWARLETAVQPPTRDLFAAGAGPVSAPPAQISSRVPSPAPVARPAEVAAAPAAPAGLIRPQRGISLANWRR